MKALSISKSILALTLALALCIVTPGHLVRADDSTAPEMTESDRQLIELNKVLVIPQKCAPTDGAMTCDPNANLPADSSSDSTGATADPSAEPSSDADATAAKAPEADPDSVATASASRDASATTASSNPGAAPDSVQDISNPDVPLPSESTPAQATAAANDPNAPSPEYGTLEDYQQTEQDVVMVPVPLPVYTGSLYATGPRVYYPSPAGGVYAAGRVTTSTYTPPFGPPGPWLSSPAPFGRAPRLAPAPRSFAFHH